MPYVGNPPRNANFLIDQFNGNAADTNFSLQLAPASTASMIVMVDGIRQSVDSYSLVGNTLVFSEAPPTGTNNIEVVHFTLGVTTSEVSDSTISDNKLTASGVTAGTYGNESSVSQITVSSKGRITSASNTSILNPLLFTG